MKLTKNDVVQIENLMKITRQGTFTLSGIEALVFSDCIRWLAGLHQVINKELEESEKPKITVNEVIPPIKESNKKSKKD